MFYRIILLTILFTISSIAAISQVSNEEESKKKFKITKNMIKIDGLKGEETVKVGQQLLYSASVHGSVGYSVDVSSSNNLWLPLVENHLVYDDEEKAKMSGGDAATEYFVFDAKKAGTYEINARHYFRGDLENDFVIVITVEDDASKNSETTIEEVKSESSEQTKQKGTRKRGKIKLNSSNEEITVKVGRRLKYSASVHGSVGISASASSSDEEGLPMKKSSTKYDNPIRGRRMPGADSATKHFVFKATKPGTYEIRIRESFRGELSNEKVIVVTVE